MSPFSPTTLSEGWHFAQVPISDGAESLPPDLDALEWQTCSSFPTSVHVELKRSGKIPDPFKDLAEWDCQWIQEKDWVFRTDFEVGTEQLKMSRHDMVFDGLDTYCHIYLNGREIGYTDNMFIPHRVPAQSLRVGQNDLVLLFKSPWHAANKEQADNGGKRQCWNGDPNRLYSRKAQYGWGWDWGPIMMTVGPFRPVRLESYHVSFDEIRTNYAFAEGSYDRLEPLSADITIVGILPREAMSNMRLVGKLRQGDGREVACVDAPFGKNDLDMAKVMKFGKVAVDAWYPIRYGKQPIYTMHWTLIASDGQIIAETKSKIAFRKVELIQEALIDQPGTSFLFQINGIRIFCGGSNWIPADSFLTEITPERYENWVELMVQGNQNMLRIWGGGVYEHETLYDACDARGILVWQDFMFGCGIYPSYPKLNDNIEREAKAVIQRLRNHPSVVIFAGNNEDYAIAESLGFMDYDDNSGRYMDSKFPARHIYEVLLPKLFAEEQNFVYHRGSPYGGRPSSDPTIGDIHQWNVWHGSQESWHQWDNLAGRFVSEFGMQGYPDRRTVEQWTDDKVQLFPQSRIALQHNKADGCERRLALYLTENFKFTHDMPTYIYSTQLMQAECLGAAYRLWRRNWKGKGREYTAGALVWQLNDCWPCVSWAIADYYLRPKEDADDRPAFYAIKRELADYTVGITRKELKKIRDPDYPSGYTVRTELQIWACNSTLTDIKARLLLVTYDLDNHEQTSKWYEKTFTLLANRSTELDVLRCPGQTVRKSVSVPPRPIVVQARLYDASQTSTSADMPLLARHSSWPEPYKYLTLSDPGVKAVVQGDEVTLECDSPVKGVILDTAGEEYVKFSDQAIDLFPGDAQVVTAEGLGDREVLVKYYPYT